MPGDAVELELAGRALLRDRRADVRRRAARRHHPLRGLVPERRDRDQPRQRGARCSRVDAGQERADPPGRAVSFGHALRAARDGRRRRGGRRLWAVFRRLHAARSSTGSRRAGTRCGARTRSRAFEAALAALDGPPARRARPRHGHRRRRVRGRCAAFPRREVVGVDLAERDARRGAAGRRPSSPERVRFERADASALPFADGSLRPRRRSRT